MDFGGNGSLIMTSRIIVAIVAIVAVVLSFAAPVDAAPVSVSCSDAADTVWRFYAPANSRATPTTFVYDFEVWQTNPIGFNTIIRLDVQQYIRGSGWNTRLSIPRTTAYFNGNVRLQTRQWTDVRVGCEGEGEVILKVNHRVLVESSWEGSAGAYRVVEGARCDGGSGRRGWFDVDRDGQLHIWGYATGSDTTISLGAQRGTQTFIMPTESDGTLYVRRPVHDATGRVNYQLSCRTKDGAPAGTPYEERERVLLWMTISEPVELRRVR